MHLHTLLRTQRQSISLSLCYLIVLQVCLQTFNIAPVNGDLDFWTKLKLIGLLALTKKISVVPIPFLFPLHLEGKEEVVYLKAPPPPPISSAYSYSPMMEYSHEHPRYVRPPKPRRAYYSRPISHHDAVGHASEIVPIIAESGLRYGERIVPGVVPRPSSAPTQSPRPIHRHRTHRTRVVVRPKIQSSVEYYQPPQTTPAPPVPAPIANDYSSYKSSYESEVARPQVESIAIGPVKSEMADISESGAPQLQTFKPSPQSTQSTLPENLLNYIRQVQGLPVKSQNDGSPAEQLSSISESAQPVDESYDQGNPDKWQPSRNITNDSELASSRPSEQPESVPLLTQLPPKQSSSSIEHQQNAPLFASARPAPSPVSTPIQYQWQNNFPSVISSSSPSQYQASDYVYKPPELKVIRNLPRYNPNLEQSRPPVKPAPLRQSFASQVNSNQATESFTNLAPSPPQQSQFIYSVTHSNPPSAPFSFSPASQYPSSDNFGLSVFRQSQLKNGQPPKPATYLPSLTAAASVESAKWIKPTEKGAKSKFLDKFGHRLSQLF